MIELDQDALRTIPAVSIKVIGIGGAGGNTVNSIIESGYEGIEYIAANTDVQALENSKASKKIRLGAKSTKGLGTGANPEIGKRAAEENLIEIMEHLEEADIVFLTGGMGGGTGSGALPVIARALREKGILSIAVVTKPFIFEGKRRGEIAQQVIEGLVSEVDTLIVIPNQKLLEVVDQKVSMIDAFGVINQMLGQSVKGIADIISKPGHINVDFADVRTIMKDRGLALMGTAKASGPNRAQEAIIEAISSPLLENMSIKGARSVLLNITGGKNLSLHEISQAASIVYEEADADAQIILGSVIDDALGDAVSITIIASGFDQQISKDIRIRATVRDVQEPVRQIHEEQAAFAHRSVAPAATKEPQSYQTREDLLLDKEELDVPAFLRKESRPDESVSK